MFDPVILSATRVDISTIRERLQALYQDLDVEINQDGPRCQLSGRCCRFEEYGHTLFLSAPEAAVLLADAPPTVRPLDEGATCPWQDDRGHCQAREARPLGCRVYFCDPEYESRGEDLSENYLLRLKKLTEAEGWPWAYAPLHHYLRAAREVGMLPDPRVEPETPDAF